MDQLTEKEILEAGAGIAESNPEKDEIVLDITLPKVQGAEGVATDSAAVEYEQSSPLMKSEVEDVHDPPDPTSPQENSRSVTPPKRSSKRKRKNRRRREKKAAAGFDESGNTTGTENDVSYNSEDVSKEGEGSTETEETPRESEEDSFYSTTSGNVDAVDSGSLQKISSSTKAVHFNEEPPEVLVMDPSEVKIFEVRLDQQQQQQQQTEVVGSAESEKEPIILVENIGQTDSATSSLSSMESADTLLKGNGSSGEELDGASKESFHYPSLEIVDESESPLNKTFTLDSVPLLQQNLILQEVVEAFQEKAAQLGPDVNANEQEASSATTEIETINLEAPNDELEVKVFETASCADLSDIPEEMDETLSVPEEPAAAATIQEGLKEEPEVKLVSQLPQSDPARMMDARIMEEIMEEMVMEVAEAEAMEEAIELEKMDEIYFHGSSEPKSFSAPSAGEGPAPLEILKQPVKSPIFASAMDFDHEDNYDFPANETTSVEETLDVNTESGSVDALGTVFVHESNSSTKVVHFDGEPPEVIVMCPSSEVKIFEVRLDQPQAELIPAESEKEPIILVENVGQTDSATSSLGSMGSADVLLKGTGSSGEEMEDVARESFHYPSLEIVDECESLQNEAMALDSVPPLEQNHILQEVVEAFQEKEGEGLSQTDVNPNELDAPTATTESEQVNMEVQNKEVEVVKTISQDDLAGKLEGAPVEINNIPPVSEEPAVATIQEDVKQEPEVKIISRFPREDAASTMDETIILDDLKEEFAAIDLEKMEEIYLHDNPKVVRAIPAPAVEVPATLEISKHRVRSPIFARAMDSDDEGNYDSPINESSCEETWDVNTRSFHYQGREAVRKVETPPLEPTYDEPVSCNCAKFCTIL